MERLLTPLLMQYGRKYFKSWPDIKLSLWGGDVKLSNLEMNSAVLEKEFGLPVSILSATIQELRIHVPWTALTSSPIEIFVKSLEIHVAEKTKSSDTKMEEEQPNETEEVENSQETEEGNLDLLGGWIDQILANISLKVDHLILKYQSGDIVFSLSSKLLEVVSSSSHPTWVKQFVDPGNRGLICKAFEMSDIVVNLIDHHTPLQNEPIIKCESILARTQFYMLPKPPDSDSDDDDTQQQQQQQQQQQGHEITPRLDFFIKKPLSVNIRDKYIPLIWKLLGVSDSGKKSQTPSPKQQRKPKTPKKPNQQQKILEQQQQQKQQQKLQKQQQQQQGWVSWAWGMVVEDVQADRDSSMSITSVSLADVFSTCQISLFIESIDLNLFDPKYKLPIASLNILACAFQLDINAKAPEKQEMSFGLQSIELVYGNTKLLSFGSKHVPQTFLPLSLFDPNFFNTIDTDSWRYFHAIRLKYTQEPNYLIYPPNKIKEENTNFTNKGSLTGIIGDIEIVYDSNIVNQLLEFSQYKQNYTSNVLVPTSSVIHKYASPARIITLVESVWNNSPPISLDITMKKLSVTVPIEKSSLVARLSNVTLSNIGNTPKQGADGSIDWKDYMYDQYSIFVDEFKLYLDQDFIIEPISATLQFSTHLVTETSLLPFEFPALTASCSLPKLSLCLTQHQYTLLQRLSSNSLVSQMPGLINQANKLKFQLQGLNILFEKNHTYYKAEGGLTTMTLMDVTNAVKPINTTLDSICFPSPTRDPRFCTFLIRLPVSSDVNMPRAPSPHCPTIKLKFSGFSFAFDSKALLPFIFPPNQEIVLAQTSPNSVTSLPPAIHTSWESYVASGTQLDIQFECISVFLPFPEHDQANALHSHFSRFNVLGTTNPATIKLRLESLSLSIVDNYASLLSRPHKQETSPSPPKFLSDFDMDIIITHGSSPRPLQGEGVKEVDPFAGNRLEFSVAITKPIQIEASKKQLTNLCSLFVDYSRLLENTNSSPSSATILSGQPLPGYVIGTFIKCVQITVKLFIDDNTDFVQTQIGDFEGGYVQGMSSYRCFGKITSFSFQFSEFSQILGNQWNNYHNMISFPNKNATEPFVRFDQMVHESTAKFLSISTSSIDLIVVFPIITKILSMSNELAALFPVPQDQVHQPLPLNNEPYHFIFNIGPLQISIPHPDESLKSLHVFSLKIAEIKTAQPSRDILQLLASSLSLESASFVNEDGNNNNNNNITTESVLAPANIMVDTHFETTGKVNISVVVERIAFTVSTIIYNRLLKLAEWTTALLASPQSQTPSHAVNQNSSNIQITTLLRQVEVELKKEAFKLVLISHNSQLTYATVPGGYIFESKIRSASIFTSIATGDLVHEQTVLTARAPDANLVSVTSVCNPVEMATTVDIQPLIVNLNDATLREILTFFSSDNQLSANNSIPPNNPSIPPRASKTKVIVENLELVINSSSEPTKTIDLSSTQLFFASQPFKAGLIEGTQYDITIVDLQGSVAMLGEKFHVLGPASAQLSMLSTSKTFSLNVGIPLLSGHINIPHLYQVVDVYNAIMSVFSSSEQVSPAVTLPDSSDTWTYNDLRLGYLRFIEERDVRPRSGEISFSSDKAQLPWMSWRYAEPRALGCISMKPPSVSSFRNEKGISCMLTYWDELLQSFVEITRFTFRDSAPPLVFKEHIYANEFRVTVMTTQSGLTSPTMLAVSLCIDSLSSPSRVPSFLCNVSCAVGDLTIMRPIAGSREELYSLKLDNTVYRMTSWSNLGAMKLYTTSNLSLDYHEYSNLNFVPLIDPVLLKLTMEKHTRPATRHLPLSPLPSTFIWTVDVSSSPIDINISSDSISHVTKSICDFQKTIPESSPEHYSRFTFANMTNEDLFFGQAGTDEGIFLPSKQKTLYRWRSKTDQNLVDIWMAGSQRFGKPLSIVGTGPKTCKITYKGWDIASWVLVEESGLHTTVTIFGTHKLTNWLPFSLDVQVDAFSQIQTLSTEESCGFFCPGNTVSHVSLRLGPDWNWSVPLPLAQNPPLLVEISPSQNNNCAKSSVYLWFQVSKNLEGGCLVSFWPIFFFKNKSGQTLEFSAMTPQDACTVTGLIDPSPSQASNANTKTKSLIPVPFSMTPRKNPGFCFRIKNMDNESVSTPWSDPPIVVGPRSLPDARASDISKHKEISQNLVTMNGKEYSRMNVKVKSMARSPSICLVFNFPCEFRNETDCLLYFAPKVTKGPERSSMVIPVSPGKSVPFDFNMRSNNLDFSRIWVGIDSINGITWTSKPMATTAKTQITDISLIDDIEDKMRVNKFVAVVDTQKNSNRICVRPQFVIANQTGLQLTLHCGDINAIPLAEKCDSVHLLNWETSSKNFLDFPPLRLSAPTVPSSPAGTGIVSGLLDASKNLSQARVAIKTQNILITYSISRSETTGVTTIVLFHDTHPPVVLHNNLEVPLLYSFKRKTTRVTFEDETETVLNQGTQKEDAWDYFGFSDSNENVTSRLIPPPLLVRIPNFQQLFEIDIVHDKHICLELSNEEGTLSKCWAKVEVQGCSRFVSFSPNEFDPADTNSATAEWHISAAIAEIGISIFEHKYDPEVVSTPAKETDEPNQEKEKPNGKEIEKEKLNIEAKRQFSNNTSLRESLHITLEGVQLRVEMFGNETTVVACATIFQVDNLIPEFEFPVVLAPMRDLSKSNAQIRPTIDLFLHLDKGTHKSHTYVRDAEISMKAMVLNLEDRHLLYIAAVSDSLTKAIYTPPLLDSRPPDQIKDIVRFTTTREFLAEIIEAPFYIAKLKINTISLHLTVHATLGIFLGIQHTHIPLPQVHLEKILATQRSLVEYLLAQYMAAGVLRGAAAVLSLELLGNPGGLFHEICAGVRDALTLPLTGLARGSPTEFVDGLRGGTLSLVRHISHGTLGSVHVLSDALSRNLLQLSMDSGLLATNWEAHQERSGIRGGVSKGLRSLGYGIWSGLSGIVTEPVKGYMSEDSGVVIGVGKGLVGAVTKPILGFTELVAHTTGGILHTTSLSYLPARRRTAKIDMLTTASWTKLCSHFVAKDESYVIHLMATFITASKRHPNCILLLTTKRLKIIDNATEETWRTVPVESIDRVDEILSNNNTNTNTNNNNNNNNNNSNSIEDTERSTMVHTRDGAQVNFIISNSYRKVALVQALNNLRLKRNVSQQ